MEVCDERFLPILHPLSPFCALLPSFSQSPCFRRDGECSGCCCRQRTKATVGFQLCSSSSWPLPWSQVEKAKQDAGETLIFTHLLDARVRLLLPVLRVRRRRPRPSHLYPLTEVTPVCPFASSSTSAATALARNLLLSHVDSLHASPSLHIITRQREDPVK